MQYRKRCKLDFTDKRVIGIVGANESGKSTLLRAISYLLYGRAQTDREVELINSTVEGGDLIVQGEVILPDGSVLGIERGRTSTNQGFLSCTGFGGKNVTDVAQYIQSKVGLCYEDFIGLSYFVQGDIHQFMLGNKREYFKRWASSLQVWAQYEAEAAQRVKTCETTLNRVDLELERIKDVTEEKTFVHAEMFVVSRDLERLKSDHTRIDARIEKVRKIYNKLARVKSDEKANVVKFKREVLNIEEALRDVRMLIGNAKRDLKNASSGRCPILDIFCDDLKLAGERDRSEAIARIEASNELESKLEKKLIAAQSRYQKSLDRARTGHNKKLQKCEDLLRRLEEKRFAIEKIFCEYSKRLGGVSERLKRVQAATAVVKRQIRRKFDIEKELASLLFVRYMCGRSGIPSFVIDRELEIVEDQCNWVLDRLGYRKRVQFQAFKELATFEKHCPKCGSSTWYSQQCVKCGSERPRRRKDEPEVIVIDGQFKRPFSLESGGAQVLQSFAVRLASSLFLSSMSGIPMQMIMLDEIFGMLDATNRQNLMSLIIGKLRTEFGLQQQFIVSHQEDIINAVDNIIAVKIEGGSSIATWE